MNFRKISLVIILLLSVCLVYSQTTITVNGENTTGEVYVITVTFNQDAAIPTNGTPFTFEVDGGNPFNAVYEFDEDDVNLESITCTYKQGGSPIGYIDSYNWLSTVSVYPSNTFECIWFESVNDYENFEFKIY